MRQEMYAPRSITALSAARTAWRHRYGSPRAASAMAAKSVGTAAITRPAGARVARLDGITRRCLLGCGGSHGWQLRLARWCGDGPGDVALSLGVMPRIGGQEPAAAAGTLRSSG